MEAPHTGQKANTDSGSPIRYEATSSNSSLDIKAEKTPVEDAITSPRPNFWRRIWDRLSGSTSRRHPNKRARPSPTPVPTCQEWTKPKDTPTVQRGRLPTPRRFKFTITRTYAPVTEHATWERMVSAPWLIRTTLFSNTVDGLVCAPPRWPEHLHQCWYDKLSVIDHPMDSQKRTYERRIRVAHRGSDRSHDWSAGLLVCSDDAKWLAALTYSDMRGMLLHRSLTRTTGRVYESSDRLLDGHLIYLHFSKPGFCEPWFSNLPDDEVPSKDAIYGVLDIQNSAVFEKFDKNHSKSEDWSL